MFFAIHWYESAMGLHVFPILTPLPPPFPFHPFVSSQCRGILLILKAKSQMKFKTKESFTDVHRAHWQSQRNKGHNDVRNKERKTVHGTQISFAQMICQSPVEGILFLMSFWLFSCSVTCDSATSWTAACQASL